VKELVDAANNLMWGSLLIWLLLGAGLVFTVMSGFIQVRHFGHTFGVMKRSFRREHGGISSFEAYCTSLGARVGTGNLAGVAVALELGGPGAVFWMWVTAMLGMATSFFESTLAQLFKVPNGDGSYRGGPAFYMQYGLGKRWMGVLFSVFLILAYPIAFNGVQSNTMAAAVAEVTDISTAWMGVLTAFFVGLVIFGGIRRIARVAEIVVPFMALAYLGMALWLMATHADRLPGGPGSALTSSVSPGHRSPLSRHTSRAAGSIRDSMRSRAPARPFLSEATRVIDPAQPHGRLFGLR